MRQVLKRDWEMVRIFFILATLTAFFVWGVQSLILTPPTVGPQIHSYSLVGSNPDGTGLRQDAVLSEIDLFPDILNSAVVKRQNSLRNPPK